VTDFAPTHILHLAAQAGVRYSLTHPQKYVQANLEGFVNVLEICRERPSIKLVYASSSSVYGANPKIPFAVEDHTDHPTSLYGATKKANEVLAHAYHHCFDLSVTGLRFFTVYGPWGRPDMAYFSFTQAIMEGKPIKLFNHGQMQRDFTYIDDVVDGILKALDLGAPYEIFNLGNNQPVSLLRFVELIEQATGKQAIKEFAPMATGDVPTTYADISHSTKKLGFAPKISLSEGIVKFVDWYHHYTQTAASLLL
jgi:UDP-glucuronate 4-epimerase